MSDFLVTGGRGLFGGGAILQLLVAGAAPRSVEESPGHAAEQPATPNGDVPSHPASLIVPVRDHDGESVDGVAGSEFVDDRIRLRE
jgi:hypothetical protein